MLQVRSIDVSYGSTAVLHDVSLEIGEGEVVCLLGRNGAGKSTTISSIVGFVPLRRGSIHFDGADVSNWPIERRA